MNKVYWKNSKQKFAKSCGNLSDMQAVITVVISLVLMSIYNKENIYISLYNFKTGCVITETLKCEHKGKKCCSIASITRLYLSEEKRSYKAPKVNVNLRTVSYGFDTPCKQIKASVKKTFRVFVETFSLLRSML